MKTLLAIFLIAAAVSTGLAQDVLNHQLDGSEQGKSLAEYLRSIEKNSNSKFYFIDQWLEPLHFEKEYQGITLEEALKKILQGTDISFTTFYNYAVVFAKDPNRTLEKMRFIQSIKTEKKQVEAKSIGKKENTKPGSVVELSGTVKDGKTQGPLPGAVIQVKDGKSIISSPDGTFKLQLPVGEYFIVFQYSNYEEKIINLGAYENGEVTVELMETPKVLDEVIVTGRQGSAVTSNVGQIDLKMAQLKKLPTFLGEIDIIKQI